MLDVSIIICFHPCRQDNLEQMFRMNKARDGLFDKAEIILACQTNSPSLALPYTKLINLNLSNYNRPLMINEAAKQCSKDILFILDGDRIISNNYLTQALNEFNGNIIAPKNVLNLNQPFPDEFIHEYMSGSLEVRSIGHSNGKGAFSGNTIISKSDYFDYKIGDENFFGYGYNDNDMERTALAAGLNINLIESIEVHLFHLPSVCIDGYMFGATERVISLIRNGLKFEAKWKTTPLVLPDLINTFKSLQDEIPFSRREEIEKMIKERKPYESCNIL